MTAGLNFPVELLVMIFERLPIRDLYVCRGVSQRWQHIIDEESASLRKMLFRMRETDKGFQVLDKQKDAWTLEFYACFSPANMFMKFHAFYLSNHEGMQFRYNHKGLETLDRWDRPAITLHPFLEHLPQNLQLLNKPLRAHVHYHGWLCILAHSRVQLRNKLNNVRSFGPSEDTFVSSPAIRQLDIQIGYEDVSNPSRGRSWTTRLIDSNGVCLAAFITVYTAAASRYSF